MSTIERHSESKLLLRMSMVILLILAGSALILPAFRLLPAFKDQAKNAHVTSTSTERFPVGLPIEKETKPKHVFLPLITQADAAGEKPKSLTPERNPYEKIDFSKKGQPITVLISPQENNSQPFAAVSISFQPAHQCDFGDGQACIYQFESSTAKSVIFASVHSGVGGEAQELRNLIEGTGINQALFTKKQVKKNIQSIAGSKVSLTQSKGGIEGLQVAAILRVAPEHLEEYLDLPVEKSFDYAMQLSGIDPDSLNQNLFVLETCGWQLPDEVNLAGFPNTTGSIYLVVIGTGK